MMKNVSKTVLNIFFKCKMLWTFKFMHIEGTTSFNTSAKCVYISMLQTLSSSNTQVCYLTPGMNKYEHIVSVHRLLIKLYPSPHFNFYLAFLVNLAPIIVISLIQNRCKQGHGNLSSAIVFSLLSPCFTFFPLFVKSGCLHS